MKKAAIISIICWSLVAVLLLAGLWYGLNHSSGWSLPFLHIGSDEKTPFEGETAQSKTSHPAQDITQIQINWMAGDIHIVQHNSPEIAFEQTSSWEIPEERLLRYRQQGGKLTINEGNTRLFTSLKGKTNLTVYLPQNCSLQEFSVDMASAALTIDCLQAQAIRLDTASGSITLGQVQTNSLEIDSASGSVGAENLQAEQVDINTASGSVDLTGSIQEIDCDTASGSVTVDSAVCPRQLDADTVSGSVTLRIPENAGFTATLSAVSGSLSTSFPCELSKGKAVYGDGSAQFSVNSVSGSFQIKLR